MNVDCINYDYEGIITANTNMITKVLLTFKRNGIKCTYRRHSLGLYFRNVQLICHPIN